MNETRELLNQALKNYTYKFEDSPYWMDEKRHFIFVNFKDRVYYEVSEKDPMKDEQEKNAMLTNIKFSIVGDEVNMKWN